MTEPERGATATLASPCPKAPPGTAARLRARRHPQEDPQTDDRRRLLRVGIVVVAVVVVLAGSVIGYVEYRNHQIHHIVVGDLAAMPPSGVENIVLVGSTSRCALKQQNKAFGLCSEGVTGVNSDVVMILHLNPNTKHGRHPVDPPRPLRPQRPRQRGQQDRRRPGRGARSNW